MSLGHALNNAYSGLTVSSRKVEVTANNIANSSTPGYIKRSLEVASVSLGGRGAGVEASAVVLASDPALTADRRLADAEAAGRTEVAEAWSNLARLIGDPDDPGAMTERYEALENALRMVANDPSSSNLQTDVITKAQDLIDGFDYIQNSLTEMRGYADRQIGQQVDFVNVTIEQIHQLNIDIQKEVTIGGDASELIAQRSGLIDSIAEIVPVKTYPGANGSLLVTTDTGYTMVSEGRIFELEFDAAPAVTADLDLIGGAPGPLSGLTMHGQDVTPPTSHILSSGTLAGLFEVRDVVTVEFQDQIDALAQDLIDRFEAADASAGGLFVDPEVTRASNLFELGLNLPSSATAAPGAVRATTVDYMDANGVLQTLTATFETTGVADEWTMTVADSGTATASNPIAVNTLTFDASGNLATVVNVSGDTYDGVSGAIDLTVDDAVSTVSLSLGLIGAAGFLSQRNEVFGPANEAATPKGLAGRLSLNALVDPAAGGDASLLRDGLGATATGEAGYDGHAEKLFAAMTSSNPARGGTGVTGNYSAFDLVAGVSSIVSTSMLAAEQSAALRVTRQQTLETAEGAALGVNLDFELQELNLIQTAYTANAQVLQVIDELIQQLLEM